MLLRIARASPALARLRPALGRALPPALAASVATTIFSPFSAPALCMYPPLDYIQAALMLRYNGRKVG